MPGIGKPNQRIDLNSKRANNPKGKQHAGRPVVRGGQQLPTAGGKPVGPGTGRVKGVPSIGDLLPRTGKPSGTARGGKSAIEDRRKGSGRSGKLR
jgi:hypothetical protein